MVPFLDLKTQYQSIKNDVDAAVLDVIGRTQFVLGDDVAAFEEEFASYCGVAHCVALNSGTSALHMALLALEIGPGDEVITVASTFIATVAAIRYVGATPVFVDVDPDTWTMDPTALEARITPKTKAIMPVHLHGQAADMTQICAIADAHDLFIIEDAAQAHGARHKGRAAGSFGAIGGFSFYPGKNLGAYGEGGAAVTNDPDLARKIRILRDWGQEEKHHHDIQGYNARMDGIQGAVLRIKLRHLDAWTDARIGWAKKYSELLSDLACGTPQHPENGRHVFHVYSVVLKDRARIQDHLTRANIGTNIHYPIPVHLQKAHADLGYRRGDLPVTEHLADSFLSLPMYAEMTDAQVEEVAAALGKALNG